MTKPCVKCGACDRYEKSGKCKPCSKARRKIKYQKNRHKILQIKLTDEQKEKRKIYLREYREKNSELIKAKSKAKRLANQEKISERSKRYYEKNRDKILEASSEYQKKNKEAKRAYAKDYVNKRKQTDTIFALSILYRTRTGQAFSNSNFEKKKKVLDLLGCNWDTLKSHIESQFEEGMTWDNRGIHGWHVDHKIPLASAATQEELESLCRYTNLQPLWAKDNLSKNSMLPCGKRIKKKATNN